MSLDPTITETIKVCIKKREGNHLFYFTKGNLIILLNGKHYLLKFKRAKQIHIEHGLSKLLFQETEKSKNKREQISVMKGLGIQLKKSGNKMLFHYKTEKYAIGTKENP